MQVWNVLHADHWKYRMQTSAKIPHLRTVAQICPAISSQLRHVSTIRKKLLSNNISSTCLHNMANFGPLIAETVYQFGAPHKFQRVSRLAFVTSATSLTVGQPIKLCMMLGHLLGWYTINTFSGALAPWRNFARCKIHFTSQVLRSPILAALLHGTPTAGFSQTRLATRNGITELWQRAPPIFGWVAITLGIGLHSSYGHPME